MQVSVENVGKLERKLTVRLPAEGLQSQVAARLRDLGRSVRIHGFRPGKVPPRVIEQRFGAQVRSEALGEVIRQGFTDAVQQENLRPAVAPSIEATSTGEDGEEEANQFIPKDMERFDDSWHKGLQKAFHKPAVSC